MTKSESRTELKSVRDEIRLGAEQLDRVETVDGEEVLERWRAKHHDLLSELRKTPTRE